MSIPLVWEDRNNGWGAAYFSSSKKILLSKSTKMHY